jgi:predicted MPP superfamily phosphohydrolase
LALVERVTISLPRLPAEFEGITVAVIADVHARPRRGGDGLAEVVRTANGLRPDLTLLLGDIVHAAADARLSLSTLSGLRAREGIYACLGNHEHGFVWYSRRLGPAAAPSTEEWRRLYAEAGIDLLVNEARPLVRGPSRIWLLGVDDAYSGHDDLSTALAPVQEGEFRLLLTHSPDIIDSLGNQEADAVLAAHTHGGQVRLPWLGPLFAPCRRFRERAAGFVHSDDTTMYVTRGPGEGAPFRLRCPRELPLIALQRDRPA